MAPADGLSSAKSLVRRVTARHGAHFRHADVRAVGQEQGVEHRGVVVPTSHVGARRAGVKNSVMPKDNEKDLADIPKNVLDSLNVYMVQTMDEVLKITLAGPLVRCLPAEAAGPVDSAIIDDTIAH